MNAEELPEHREKCAACFKRRLLRDLHVQQIDGKEHWVCRWCVKATATCSRWGKASPFPGSPTKCSGPLYVSARYFVDGRGLYMCEAHKDFDNKVCWLNPKVWKLARR